MDIKQNIYNIEWNLPVMFEKLGSYVRTAGAISFVIATLMILISTYIEVKNVELIILGIYALSVVITNYIAFKKYNYKVEKNVDDSLEELERCFLSGNINSKGVIKSQRKCVFKNMKIILNVLIWDMAYICVLANYFLKAQVQNYALTVIVISLALVSISLVIAVEMKKISIKSFKELFIYYGSEVE